MPARRRSWIVGALVLGAAGVSYACQRGAAAGTLVDAPCQVNVQPPARCATLSVFENRSAKSGRIIPLRIVVLRASGAERDPDPIFFLAGGPGQAATTMVTGYGKMPLRARRDLVLVDQRGTGGSNGLTCQFYGPPHDPQSYFDQFLPPAKVKACRDELERRADLTQYTTADAVEDLDEVRAALGYDRINLAGGSYGTRLALEYVRRYESRVRAVVLDGAVPVSKRAPEDFGRLAQRALDALFEECAADRECAAAFPGIRDETTAVFRRLAEAPVRASATHPASGRKAQVTLTRDHVAEAIRYMMYSSGDAASVPLFLHEAYNGDYSPIAQFLIQHRHDGTFDGLYLSITCAEDVPFVSDGAERRDAPTYLGAYRIREQRAACAEWRRGRKPDSLGTEVSARVPALILSGALDPVTPPDDGALVAKALPASLHLTIPFGGHSYAGLNGLDCVQRLRSTFIEQGSARNLDTSCLSNIARPGFVTRRSTQ